MKNRNAKEKGFETFLSSLGYQVDSVY